MMSERTMQDKKSTGTCYLEYRLRGDLCRFPLHTTKVCAIGRSEVNTIALCDIATVSLLHASVHCVDGSFFLADLNSRNGTMLNGRPVTTPTPLKEGDVIQVGGYEISFHGTSSDAPPSEKAFRTHLRVSRSLVTVLVADIKDYTGLTLKLGEDRMSEIIGMLFERAGEILSANLAWGQKYIGDAVMGVWVHEQETPTKVEMERIFRSLLGIEKVFDALNRHANLPVPICFGAAVNTGFASTGNLGSKAVPDQTAIGDSVNMAFRLESATRSLNVQVVLGKMTYNYLSSIAETCEGIERRAVALKGYAQLEEAYATDFSTLARILRSAKLRCDQ